MTCISTRENMLGERGVRHNKWRKKWSAVQWVKKLGHNALQNPHPSASDV
jgi:hypothetical protein